MANMCVGSSHFPFKVHVILERGYDCIEWCGPNCFRLTDSKGFVSNVLPKYFKHEKLSSFTRQLNIYGFHKIREGPLKGAYTHEDFMRGNLERVSSIPRAKRSGSREVMKARESRNASVIYSSMMMRKATDDDDDTASCSSASGSDYSSDSSGTTYVQYQIDCHPAMKTGPSNSTAYVAPAPVNEKRKRCHDVANAADDTPNLFAILEKTRFSYKERSYIELKAETEMEMVSKKMKLTHQVVKTENEVFPSPSPEFESGFSEDFAKCDFSGDDFGMMPFGIPNLPRSITQQMAGDGDDDAEVDIDVLVDVLSEHEPVEAYPQRRSSFVSILDVSQSEIDFSLFKEGANTSAFSTPQFSTCCW